MTSEHTFIFNKLFCTVWLSRWCEPGSRRWEHFGLSCVCQVQSGSPIDKSNKRQKKGRTERGVCHGDLFKPGPGAVYSNVKDFGCQPAPSRQCVFTPVGGSGSHSGGKYESWDWQVESTQLHGGDRKNKITVVGVNQRLACLVGWLVGWLRSRALLLQIQKIQKVTWDIQGHTMALFQDKPSVHAKKDRLCCLCGKLTASICIFGWTGISSLIGSGVYTAAYPLHDVSRLGYYSLMGCIHSSVLG